MKKLLFIILTAALFAGCSKSKDEPANTAVVFKFKANGVQYNLSGSEYDIGCFNYGTSPNYDFQIGASRPSPNTGWEGFVLNFTSNSPLKVQTYPVYDDFLGIGSLYSENNIVSFNVTFTEIQAHSCSGTFSGTLRSGGGGDPYTGIINITEGVFQNVPLFYN